MSRPRIVLSAAAGLLAAACADSPMMEPAINAANFQVGGESGSPRPKRGDVTGATPDTYQAVWVTGVSQDGGANGQSIAMTDFAFYSFRNWWDHNLSDVKKVRASFLLTATNSGGSPRFSMELSNGVVVYLDPAHCSDAVRGGWVESDFTGDRTNCTIYTSSGFYASDRDGTAWSKVVAANVGATVYFMYLIQDATVGTNNVDRIMLDNALFTSQP